MRLWAASFIWGAGPRSARETWISVRARKRRPPGDEPEHGVGAACASPRRARYCAPPTPRAQCLPGPSARWTRRIPQPSRSGGSVKPSSRRAPSGRRSAKPRGNNMNSSSPGRLHWPPRRPRRRSGPRPSRRHARRPSGLKAKGRAEGGTRRPLCGTQSGQEGAAKGLLIGGSIARELLPGRGDMKTKVRLGSFAARAVLDDLLLIN
jgi:hypothetical protein